MDHPGIAGISEIQARFLAGTCSQTNIAAITIPLLCREGLGEGRPLLARGERHSIDLLDSADFSADTNSTRLFPTARQLCAARCGEKDWVLADTPEQRTTSL
jgi:hypothetical protein